MSKFWAGSSDSSSEESSEDSFEEEKPNIPNKYAYDSDDDFFDDEVRVVRTAEQKRAIANNAHADAIKAAVPERDYNAIAENFDKLTKAVEKAMKSDRTRIYPAPYLSTVVALQKLIASDSVKDEDGKTRKKSFSKSCTKSYNSLGQKLKKFAKGKEKSLAKLDVDEEDDDTWGFWEGADDVDDDDDGFGDDDDDSESSGDAFKDTSRKSKWMMKSDDEESSDDNKMTKQERREKKRLAALKRAKKEGDKDENAQKDKEEKPWDEARVYATVKELLGTHSRAEKSRLIKKWRKLLTKASDLKIPRCELLVLVQTINAQFGTNSQLAMPMKRSMWRDVAEQCLRVVELLSANDDLELHGDSDKAVGDVALAAVNSTGSRKKRSLLGASMLEGNEAESSDDEDDEDKEVDEGDDTAALEQAAAVTNAATSDDDEAEADKAIVITGSLVSMLDRLALEWRKALQMADPASKIYVGRLCDEGLFLKLTKAIRAYYTAHASPKLAARVASRLVEHLYYRRYVPAVAAQLKARAEKIAAEGGNADPNFTRWLGEEDHAAFLSELTQEIYANGDERAQTRALLSTVYHDALHDRYSEARDAILMSYTQETIHRADVATQVLFNRAMAQIGLCAFRRGAVLEAHTALADLYSNSRVKELLAQGTVNSRYGDKTAEQEKAEKRRQIPYHMHISLEALEGVHLTTALLLEVPLMLSRDQKRRPYSRVFRRLLDYAERQVFSGPPESVRDCVVAATKCLMKGNWRECAKLLTELSCWNNVQHPDECRAIIRRLVQRTGLRAYLIAYSGAYESLSLEKICTQFDLSKEEAHAICSRLMGKNEFSAAWDQPTESILLHHVEPSRLQALSMQFADRTANFVENNERLFDARTGGYGFDDRDTSKERERNTGGRSRRRGYPHKKRYQSSYRVKK